MKRKSVNATSSQQLTQRLSAKFDSPRKLIPSPRKPEVKSILSNLGNSSQFKESMAFSGIYSLPLRLMENNASQESYQHYEPDQAEEINFLSKYLDVENELCFLEIDPFSQGRAETEESLHKGILETLRHSSSANETPFSAKRSNRHDKYEPLRIYAILPDPDNLKSTPILIDKDYQFDGRYEYMNEEEPNEYVDEDANQRQSLLKRRILTKLDEQVTNTNFEQHFKKFSVRKFLETQRIANPSLMESIVTEERLNLSKLADMKQLLEKNPGVFGEGIREKDRIDSSFSVSNILSSSRISKSKAATFFKSLNN